MELHNESTPWVERETTIDVPPEEVWDALTDEDHLREWLGTEVEPETIEEGERLNFTWERDGEGESMVEFTIEAVPAGTRVVVVETPISSASRPGPAAAAWAYRLARLHHSLSLAPVA